jgi:hypothetical protein
MYLKILIEYFPFVTKEKYSKIQRSKSSERLDLGPNFQRSAEQHKTYQKCVKPYPPPLQTFQISVGAP